MGYNIQSVKHGMHGTPEYRAWLSMRNRCLCATDKAYPRYGGRGIKVCRRWGDFMHFYSDMGPRPSGMSLDRIHNDGDYEPSNCRWANIYQQNNNRRCNRNIEFNGESKTMAQWSEYTGIPFDTLWVRLFRLKWNVEQSLTRPVRPRGKNGGGRVIQTCGKRQLAKEFRPI